VSLLQLGSTSVLKIGGLGGEPRRAGCIET